MKKLIVLTLIGFLFSVSAATASVTFTNSGTTATVTGVLNQYRTSTSVTLIANATVATYAAVSGHLQGDNMYGASAGDAVIFRADKTAGTAITATDVPTAGLTATDTAGFAGDDWSAL